MTILYAGGRILTGVNGECLEGDVGVVIEGAHIVVAGRREALLVQHHPTSIVECGQDTTILPGLIDTHVHLAFDGSPQPVDRLMEADEVTRIAIMLWNARQLLSAGVTTARDLGAPWGLDKRVKKLITSGLARGPRLQTVTAPLTITGGHCWFFGGECDGVAAVRVQVRKARREGAEAIKMIATGGNMTPGTLPSEPQFTQDEMNALVEEAHKYGLRVAAHAHGAEGMRRAIIAGVDSLEHFSFTTAQGFFDEDREIVQMAAERNIFVTKTLCAALDGPSRGMNPPQMMRSLIDGGVQIVAGTDAGIDNAPHCEYVFALEGMAAYGMSHEEVLDAATARAARSLGLEEVTGTIQPGKSADLIAVHGDPRRDLGVLRNLHIVLSQGVLYTPEFVSQRRWNDEPQEPLYRPNTTHKRVKSR